MIEISLWTKQFLACLSETFGERVWFVGLQGSYSRGEANENSDIDMVVILDELALEDLPRYRCMLDTLPDRELICGFLSGRQEILNWDPADLFQFYHDTLPIYGSLDDLLPLIDDKAVDRAIKMGAGNIYHGCVHNMLHGKSADTLRGLYKAASFLVQAICFRQTGTYIRHQTQLLTQVSPEEKVIVETFLSLKSGGEVAFDEMSGTLFRWAGKWIVNS